MHIDTINTDKFTILLQITPETPFGPVQVDNRQYNRTAAYIYIPATPGNILCPLNYFQENVSLPEKWIRDDRGAKLKLENINSLRSVVVTELRNNLESKLDIPIEYQNRLLDYLNLDIFHNQEKFKGFDCYAFVSFIANVKYYLKSPEFDYEDREPKAGEFTVLSNSPGLPESIKHWALYLEIGHYLSKFGLTGPGAQSLLEVMDLQGMKYLYQSNYLFVATPKPNAPKWDGFKFNVV